jgi:pimeloyl-ACP methyl ester carboxylesterase
VSAAALLLLAGCPSPEAPPTVDGAISWTDCRDEAREGNPALRRDYRVECGTVRVPQDWAEPDSGDTFDIALMRIYTGDASDKIGSVLTNPGGPGGSGLDFLPGLVSPPAGPDVAPLLEKFVMVSFDPRGVGKSAPVDCISDADLDAVFGADPDPVDQDDFDDAVAVSQRIADGCGAKYGDDLRLFSTVQTARDMDAIREALGDEKLTYLGFSYGTLLGAVYAQLFPTKVRAFVLDGAVDPQQDPVESSEGQAMGFERALDNFSAWCRTHRARCPIADDPRGAITDAIAKARVSPVAGGGGRDATAGWVMWGVILSMYAQSIWEYLGPAIDDLSRGDADLILALADSYAERDENGEYSNLFDANSAINCADSPYPPVDEIRALQAEWREEYPMFGPALATGLLGCSLWPGGKDPYPTGPATGAPPIVVVGTTGDPATPFESTRKLADMLGVGVVISFEGEGHTAYPESSCVQRAVDRYLIDLEVPEDGLRCTE